MYFDTLFTLQWLICTDMGIRYKRRHLLLFAMVYLCINLTENSLLVARLTLILRPLLQHK